MNGEIELRKVPAATLYGIADLLDIDNDWRRVMMIIPKNPHDDYSEPKYNNDDMRLIEDHSKITNRKCAEILFDEWGTSGQRRPTLNTLLTVLNRAERYRAVVELAKILNVPPPPKNQTGPGASIQINITNMLNQSLEKNLNSMESIESDNLRNVNNDIPENNTLCNNTTFPMESENLIIFSTDHLSSAKSENMSSVSNNADNALKMLATTDLPDFDVLNPKTVEINDSHAISMNTESSIGSEQSAQFSTTSETDSTYDQLDSDILQNDSLIKFDYKELETITNNFSHVFMKLPNGLSGKIGSGGFGDVFVGHHELYGDLAVKRVRDLKALDYPPELAFKIFNTEIRSLSLLQHENIVPILGYAVHKQSPCIVCKFIECGSLEQMLAKAVLNKQQRMNIILGTAEGLKYIHNTERPQIINNLVPGPKLTKNKSYFLHGDVKSANILLTSDFVPKLCDFGLAKQCNTTFVTKSIMGTNAYMAPESFYGTITQKNDVYSFGIVLLELITGLPALVTDGSGRQNIKHYLTDSCTDNDISIFVDKVVGTWSSAQQIYNLAEHCLQYNKDNRPTMGHVCAHLEEINKLN